MSDKRAELILVIDDDTFFLNLIEKQLLALGHDEVTGFSKADEALEFLRANPKRVGLTLCDLDMPEMDGVEFIRNLLGTGYQGGLALISGRDERVLQSAVRLATAHRIDVAGSLKKPVHLDDLAELLAKAELSHDRGQGKTGPRKIFEAEAVRAGIERGEFICHYQPQVRVRTGELVAVEALVRWQHPTQGLVYPDNFIGIIEGHGLITDLTMAVMRSGLTQLRAWDAQGIRVKLAVNVSMDSMTDLAFPDITMQLVGDFGVQVSRINLEVTESRLMKDRIAALDILTRLRLKRIGLSIDDFGTGYSSLAQLRDMPFDELKIDRSFTHGVALDSSLRAIFNANMGMARQLQMNSVAEGVEDQSDWGYLREVDCDLAQGYFIAKPMPGAGLQEWLEGWKPRVPELTGGAWA